MNNDDLKKKTISGVIWKGLERVAAQIVSALVSIILARLLMPEDYSVVSIVAIFFAFCNIFISGGLNTALIQKKDADIIDYSTILIANLIMALVLYIIMYSFAPFISRLYKKELLIPVIRVMALSFFISGYKAVLSAKIISELRFRAFFWSTIIGTLLSAVVGIYLAIKGYGAWALVAQQMTNTFFDSLILTITSRIRFSIVFSWKRFKHLFDYGGKLLLSSIIHQIYTQTKPLLVGIRFSAVDLAFYNKGKTYPELIANTANDTLSSSLFPAMSKVQDDKEAVLGMTRRFMQLSSFLVFPLMFGFLAVAEGFVRIVLTEKWLPAVPYLMIFCFSDMFKPIQTGNLQAIRAIGRSDVLLKLEILKKTFNFLIIFLFVLFTKSPILLALSGIITSITASLINTFPNAKLIGYGYRKQFEDLALNFLLSALMGVSVYCVKFVPMKASILLIVQILAGVAIYLILNVLFKNKSLMYFIATVKGFFRSMTKAKAEDNSEN